MSIYTSYVITAVAIAGFVVVYLRRHRKRERHSSTRLQKARHEGLLEPVSLHPSLDPNRCISIGACAEACPEGDIIGLVNGVPELIDPTRCIGHGACAAACPVDAITLVFGTATRGVEIPFVKDTFETNSDGIYIAGELGGMGLIRNAVTQGRQAVEHIASRNGKRAAGDAVDIVIIGAGPAGLAATLQAKASGLSSVTLEQDDIGGSVLHYPRQKLVMTQPMELPLYGKCDFREIEKEDLLDLWHRVVDETDVTINTGERLEAISRNGVFEVTSSKQSYRARHVLLAIGRRGSPRKLEVAGEDMGKVAYRLIEPEQYSGKRVLVVGGGDSAVEAAATLGAQAGTGVTLSYRKNAFSRVKPANRERLNDAVDAGAVSLLLESTVEQIGHEEVVLNVEGASKALANDYVLVFAGGVLPTQMLKDIGVQVDKKFGDR